MSQVLASAAWGTRDAGATVVFGGRLWMLGGWTFENDSVRVLTDAWSSRNGSNWECSSIPDDHGMYPMAAPNNDQLFYMGGLKSSRQPDERISNSIWISSDGTAWSLRVSTAPWDSRIRDSVLQFIGELWLLGGKTANDPDPANRRNDIWMSADGLAWTQRHDMTHHEGPQMFVRTPLHASPRGAT